MGVLQSDSLTLDGHASVAAYAAFAESRAPLVAAEANHLRMTQARGVVADIPPLAFEAAAHAGIPAVALANFAWDWIYQPYLQAAPEFSWITEQIQSSYATAALLLRLPFHGGLSCFPRCEDVPLICRRSARSREEIRRILGLEPHVPVVLLSFGGFELRWLDPQIFTALPEFQFLSLLQQTTTVDNVMSVTDRALPHCDLVHAADVVMSKPGFGIVAECLAHGRPLVYTSRGVFAEYAYLVRGLQEHGAGTFIDQDALFRGAWRSSLEAALAFPNPTVHLPANGAERAAERLIEFFDLTA